VGVRAGAHRPARRRGAGAIAVVEQSTVALPAVPYRGIYPFRYADHGIFFARDDETRLLFNLVAVYRGVLLYGRSGAGKSSLINAGLLVKADQLDLRAERVRVQPHADEEIVVERILVDEDAGEHLPSLLAPDADPAEGRVLSTQAFEERVRAVCGEGHQLLIVFDQFEEIATLFDDGEARANVVNLIVRLLREGLAVKLLIAFREDYLGPIKDLLRARPELVDQSLRLAPPSTAKLGDIISGPFEHHQQRFDHELRPDLAERVRDALADRFRGDEVSLSTVQTVCLRLWNADDPERLFEARGVTGLVEDSLGEVLESMTPDGRRAAIAVLSQMVTAAGTRNVVSLEDIVARATKDDRDLTPDALEAALKRLEAESGLVRSEPRRNLYLYEITSEFIVPWINRRREALRHEQQQRRYRRQIAILALIGLAVLGVIATVAYSERGRQEAVHRTAQAMLKADNAQALGLAMTASARRDAAPHIPVLLGLSAFTLSQRPEARGALLGALEQTRQSGTVGILHGHSRSVYTVAVSPDGKLVATGGADGAVRLWDLKTHRQVRALENQRAGVIGLAFSPDGQVLASSDRTRVHLWNPTSGEHLATLRGEGSISDGLAFTAHGRGLVAGYVRGEWRSWTLARGAPVGKRRTVRAPETDFVRAMDFSPDGRLVAFVPLGVPRVVLQDARRGVVQRGPEIRPGEGTSSVTFSPDGRTLATAGRSNKIVLWSVRTHRRLGVLRTGTREVSTLAFSPDGRRLAASGSDNSISIWNVSHRQRLGRPLKAHAGSILGLAFSGDGRRVLSAGQDGTVTISDAQAASRYGRSVASYGFYMPSALSATYAVLDNYDALGVVDLRSGQPMRRIPGSSGFANAAAISADGTTMAADLGTRRVRVWDTRSRKSLGTSVKLSTSYIDAVALNADGRRIAAGDGSLVRVWDVRGGTLRTRIKTGMKPVARVALSPDGNTVAIADREGTVELWAAVGTRLVPPLRVDNGSSFDGELRFSPDGRVLAVASDPGTVTFWDAHTGKPKGSLLSSQIDGTTAVAFSPDGSTLATGDSDYAVRLWDLASRRQLGLPLRGAREQIDSLAFSSDGRSVFASDAQGEVRAFDDLLWKNPDDVHRQVCDLVGAGLSRGEWSVFAPDVKRQGNCG
jgi:WD40 repeat protein